MINPIYFTIENLKESFENNLKSHDISHANSILTIIPTYPDFGTETIYINKILREMATIHARLINQYKLKYHILISARFYKINEKD